MLSHGPELTWMNSNGGPLLLVSGEYLSSWRGIWPPPDGQHIEAQFRWSGPDEPATDYDRACDVTGYLGLLDIGAGQGLVLGDEPHSTAWQPLPAGGNDDDISGLLIRWVYANSDFDTFAALEYVPRDAWRDDGLALDVGHEPLYLLDAAYGGSALEGEDHLTIHLPPGRYSIATTEYEPDDHTRLLLHRLTRMSSGAASV